MNQEQKEKYVLVQWDNFGSVFALKGEVDEILNILTTNRIAFRFALESEGFGYQITRLADYLNSRMEQ
jgi:hypothetical protein